MHGYEWKLESQNILLEQSGYMLLFILILGYVIIQLGLETI